MNETDYRYRLHKTFLEYAAEAERRRDWSACNAFQTAAGLALAYAVQVGEPTKKDG